MLAKGVSKYKNLSIQQQYSSLQICPLSANGSGSLNHKYFFWEFTIQPTPLSKKYLVLLVFHIDNYSPDVFVIDNEVWEISKTKIIPHLYDYKAIRLCLYYPSYKDWDKTMTFCSTFVPWTYLWLYYYEEWLYSDDWKGGGIHPERNKKEEASETKISPLKKLRNRKENKIDKADKAKQIIYSIYERRKKAYMEKEGLN